MATDGRQTPIQNRKNTSAVRDLILRAREGDENAFTALFRGYSPLIDSLIAKSLPSGVPESDLRSDAIDAFSAAVFRYDTEQSNVTFGLYARICIANRLVSALRAYRKVNHTVSLEGLDPDALPAGEESDPSQYILEEERYTALCRKMEAVLSDTEREVWMLFISGLTAPQIADRLGTDKKSVENTLYRARKKLRKSFSET